MIVHDPVRGEDHAIAAARLDGRWLTLDNRRMAMVEDVDARNYRPIFVIDRDLRKRYEAAPLLAGMPRPPCSVPVAPEHRRGSPALISAGKLGQTPQPAPAQAG